MALLVAILPGCSRMFWRSQADFDTYNQLMLKTQDPRWDLPRLTVEPDPRSRFYDPFDLDCAPLPPDDPAANRYMHWMDGMRGYKNWHKFGETPTIDSPFWEDNIGRQPEVAQASWEAPAKPLPEEVASGQVANVRHVPTIEDLVLEEAIELAAIHSRDYQFEIENLYLSALALTFDQFQFNVRYLGLGNREPTSDLTYFNTPSGESAVYNNRFGVSQLLPTGAQWTAELANNTLWLFQGQNRTSSTSVLTYQLTQPLLLGAGRKVVLEGLTQAERDVLYDVRSLARFRKIFFGTIVVNAQGSGGFLGLLRLQQQVLNQRDNIRQLAVQVERSRGQTEIPPAEAIEALPEGARDPNDPDSLQIPEDLAAQLTYNPTLKRLRWTGPFTPEQRERLFALSDAPSWRQAIANLYSRAKAGVIPLTVAQLITRLSGQISQLRNLERQYLDFLDQYKLQLGLPTDLQMTVNNRLLQQFELIDPRINAVEQSLLDYKQELAMIDELDPSREDLLTAVERLEVLRQRVKTDALDVVAYDFERAEAAMPNRLSRLTDPRDREVTQQDMERNQLVFREVILGTFSEITADLKEVRERLEPGVLEREVRESLLKTPDANQIDDARLAEGVRAERQRVFSTIDKAREDLLQIAQNLKSVEAGVRSELIELQEFTMTQDQVVALAVENRLDLMNQRGFVMDARRQMEIAANRLEAVLNLVARGDLRNTGGSNPVDFRGDESTFQAGVQFTAPLDQVLERNAYRAAQIEYQRARRDYMELEDQIKFAVRTEWRLLQTLKANFETTRQNLRIAAIQLDSAVETFNQPTQSGQVGRAQQAGGGGGGGGGGGQDPGLGLINALQSVLNAQNDLIQIWVQYEQNRINIHRDMDIMQVDERGLWLDPVYQNLPSNPRVTPTLNEPAHEDARLPVPRDFTDALGRRYLLRDDLGLPRSNSSALALAATRDDAVDPGSRRRDGLPVARVVAAGGTAAADADRPLLAPMAFWRTKARRPDHGDGQAGAIPDHGDGAWHARQHEEHHADE